MEIQFISFLIRVCFQSGQILNLPEWCLFRVPHNIHYLTIIHDVLMHLQIDKCFVITKFCAISNKVYCLNYMYVTMYIFTTYVCQLLACIRVQFFIEASFILLCIHFLYWIRTLSGFNIRPDITATSKSRSITKNINGWFTDICVGCAWAPALPAKNNNEKKYY